MGHIGIDVMHMNLHKTFSTPHGGGGPGSGAICVSKTLVPFLPGPRLSKTTASSTGWTIPSTPEGSPSAVGSLLGAFGVVLRAWAYMKTLGPDLKRASELAVLNANYIKFSLKDLYDLPFPQPSLHECVFTDKKQEEFGVSTMDIAKRLIDCGHPSADDLLPAGGARRDHDRAHRIGKSRGSGCVHRGHAFHRGIGRDRCRPVACLSDPD